MIMAPRFGQFRMLVGRGITPTKMIVTMVKVRIDCSCLADESIWTLWKWASSTFACFCLRSSRSFS
jgi:hypothetical protein